MSKRFSGRDAAVETLVSRLTTELGLGFASGTRMLFQQTSAPTGWTKESDAAYNDAALRLITGTISTGGNDAFSTHFGTSKATATHTLTSGEIAAHTHSTRGYNTGGPSGVTPEGTTEATSITTMSPSTTSAGGGGSHDHTLDDFDIKFVDSIIAEKD